MKKILFIFLGLSLMFGCSDDEESLTTSEPQLTYIPNDFFENTLVLQGLDDIMDNYVLTENISDIEEFYFSVRTSDEDINTIDFTGVEDFTSLKFLGIYYTYCTNFIPDDDTCYSSTIEDVYIENFDISTLIDLEEIQMGIGAVNTYFENFNLSNNINLKILEVGFNSQYFILDSTLDLSNNVNLEWLRGNFHTNENFGVNEVDVSNNINLKTYIVGCGSMNDINLNNNILLESLTLGCVEGLDELDLSNNINLTRLDLHSPIGSSIDITNLDLSNNVNLELLTIMPQYASSPGDGFLAEINLTNHPNLSYIALENNNLSELDVSNCNQESLTVYASGNNLSCVEVSQNQIDNGVIVYGGVGVQILTSCD